MKFKLIILVVAILICCNIGDITREAKHKEVASNTRLNIDDINRYIVGLDRDSDNNHRVFISGKSNHQIALEKARAERERERIEELNRVSQTSYQGSFTNQGYDVKIIGTSWEQCVIYAKKQAGITRSLGYAGSIPPQTQEAKVGRIALEWNHASYVIAVNSDTIRVKESNWRKGFITERTIPKSRIRGYIIS